MACSIQGCVQPSRTQTSGERSIDLLLVEEVGLLRPPCPIPPSGSHVKWATSDPHNSAAEWGRQAWQTVQCVMIKCLAGRELKKRPPHTMRVRRLNADSPRLSKSEQERSICRKRATFPKLCRNRKRKTIPLKIEQNIKYAPLNFVMLTKKMKHHPCDSS